MYRSYYHPISLGSVGQGTSPLNLLRGSSYEVYDAFGPFESRIRSLVEICRTLSDSSVFGFVRTSVEV